jgi:hypothetical protein
MWKLFRVIEVATRDARRAEALLYDTASLRALRADPEIGLLAFELRTGALGDRIGEQETRIARRARGVQAARRYPAVG